MTLVVARRITASSLRICADAAVFDPRPDAIRQPAVSQGILKTVLINKSLCISFAGRVDAASEALLEIGRSAALREPQAVREYLLSVCQRWTNAVDFIVSALEPDVTISRISERGIEPPTQQTWIGNAAAFSSYQARFHNSEHDSLGLPPGDAREWESILRMERAFSDLASGGEFTDVADPVIRVSTTSGGLAYFAAVVMHTSAQTLHGPGLHTLRLGSAQEGGFGYTLLTPDEPGVGAVACYFPQGHFGVVYAPLQFCGPRTIRGTHDQFVRSVFEDTGIRMAGTMVTGV